MLAIGRYTVVDTLAGRTVPQLNFGRLCGWLEGKARRSILRKDSAGPPLFLPLPDSESGNGRNKESELAMASI